MEQPYKADEAGRIFVREPIEKRPASGRAPQTSENHIFHYGLSGLLPSGHLLALNRELAILSYLVLKADEEPRPYLLLQEQFSNNEEKMLFPLLENYPHFCPYEALIACYYTGNITDASLECYRSQLKEIRLAGAWEQEMRLYRTILSRVRFKLRTFGIDVRSIVETGYILKQAGKKPL